MAAATAPNIVLIDITMPHINCIEASRQITTANPQVAVLMLTMLEDGPSRNRAGLLRLPPEPLPGHLSFRRGRGGDGHLSANPCGQIGGPARAPGFRSGKTRESTRRYTGFRRQRCPLRCGAAADQNSGWPMGQGADVVDGLGDPFLERAAGGAAGWVDEDVSGHRASGEVHRSGVGVFQGLGVAAGSGAGHEFLADHAAGHLAPIMKARPPNLRRSSVRSPRRAAQAVTAARNRSARSGS
jgi:hypothetical protein